MNKKTVLILGAGLMQKPAIQSAKELGFFTVVADGNPHAACASLADEFVNVDLKDRDGLLELAKKIDARSCKNLAGVFTAGTDFSANAAYVAEYFQLPGHRYEPCLNASDKVRMRKCFSRENVPSPDFVQIDRENFDEYARLAGSGEIDFPKVIKPVDNMGGRGCRLVRSSGEFKSAAENAVQNSRSGRAIFEDVMDGREFSIDSIVYNGTLTVTGFADRHICYPPYFIEMGHSLPSQIDSNMKNQLVATFALGVKALGLTEGVAKADIKFTKNGPMIGEIAARLSGGYMSGWTFPYASGCFLTKEALKIAVGKEPDYILKNRKPLPWQPHSSVSAAAAPFELFEIVPEKVSCERAWISIPGKIKTVLGLEDAKKCVFVQDVFPRSFSGDDVCFPRNNVEKCGNVITKAPSFDQAENAAFEAISKITLVLENKNEVTEKFLDGESSFDESGFPPAAFDFECDEDEFADVPENSRIIDFVPDSFRKNFSLCDWNHITLKKAVEKFDALCPKHKKLDGRVFWKSLLRGSIQGMLWAADAEF